MTKSKVENEVEVEVEVEASDATRFDAFGKALPEEPKPEPTPEPEPVVIPPGETRVRLRDDGTGPDRADWDGFTFTPGTEHTVPNELAALLLASGEYEVVEPAAGK